MSWISVVFQIVCIGVYFSGAESIGLAQEFDPFASPLPETQQQKTKQPQRPSEKSPHLPQLTGTVLTSEGNYAFLQMEKVRYLVKEGEQWQDYQVLKVEAEQLQLQQAGRITVLKLKSP